MEAITGIAVIALLLIIFSSSGGSNTKTYDKGELGLTRIDKGKYAVYLFSSGEELFCGTLKECRDWITRHTR